MRRRHFLVLCGSLSGLGLMSCSSRNKGRTLRVSANPHFSMSGLYLAQELGYFAKLGLDVDVKRVVSAPQAIALAAGGALDIVFSSLSAAMVNAVARGARLRVVAGREIAEPTCSDTITLYGRREVFPNGLQDLKVLKGKRVYANLDSGLLAFSVEAILAQAGLSPQELGIGKMSSAESIPALLSERIDAVFVVDFARRYPQVADRIIRGASLSDVLPKQQISFILFGKTLIDGDPDVGTRFLHAYLRGAREYLGGKTPKFHDEFAIANGIDPSIARKACRNTFEADGRIDLPSLDRFIRWAREKGQCPIPIRAEQLVDIRFLEKQKQIRYHATAVSPAATKAEIEALH